MAIKNIQIARILNISPAAVSLARNNKPGVSNETRQKVLELLRENTIPEEYPDGNNLLLIVHKTHGQVIKGTPFFQKMMESLQHIASENGYDLQILTYAPQYDLQNHIEKVRNSDARGILLLASEMTEQDYQPYKTISKPIVVIDAHFPFEDVDVVGIDNEYLIRQAVRYAVEKGHREIGFLSSRMFTFNFVDRIQAYRNAMADYHLPVREDQIFYIHSTAEQAYLDMKELLRERDLKELPSLFIAGNDLLATGAIRALKEYGLGIPEDVSVIGFDNMPLAAVMDPPLTTIDVNSNGIYPFAIEGLLDKIQNATVGNCRRDVRGHLIERGTVKTLNAPTAD